jgi:hypothetical protein
MATKMIRAVRIISIVGIISLLLVSIFASCIPKIAAGPIVDLYSCNSEVRINYDKDIAKSPLLPVNMTKEIPIEINYRIVGLYADVVGSTYASNTIDPVNYIYLYVEKTPEWCTATVTPSVITTSPLADWQKHNAVLIVQVNENAYAFAEGKIALRIETAKMNVIKPGTFYQNITFIPGYLPSLRINMPSATKFIGPGDKAEFNIEIENLGNADTLITCHVLDLPKGWIVGDISTVVGSKTAGNDPKKIITLGVISPYGFGYHNDKELIRVLIKPSYVENMSLVGNDYYLSFVVQSRGFSTPGFEAAFVLIALVVVILLLNKRQKMKRTANSKISKGRDGT